MKRLTAVLMATVLLLSLFGCRSTNEEDLLAGGVTGGQGGSIGVPDEDFNEFTEQEEQTPATQDTEQTPEVEQTPSEEQTPSQNTATNPYEPEVDLSGAVAEEEVVDYEGEGWIKVCSYNIKALYHTETSKTDVVEVLRQIDADIVGMQEVDHRLSSTGQVQYLAEQLGYSYYYFALCEEADSEGHGILSRYMIKSVKEGSYEFQQGEPRKYTRAVLDVNGTEVVWYNTHLTTGTWTQTGYQFEELLEEIYSEKSPVILTGDFNLSLVEQKKRIDIDKLLPLNGLHDMEISHPDVRWDNIMITEKDFEYYFDFEKLVGIQSMDTNASDHKPIWTYLKFK